MTADLVTRLRGWLDEDVPIGTIMNEAADEIERLSADYNTARDAHDRRAAEVIELRAALRWFVSEYDRVQPMRQARVHAPECRCILCAYDNAHAALREDGDE